jgi:hypothetical protein
MSCNPDSTSPGNDFAASLIKGAAASTDLSIISIFLGGHPSNLSVRISTVYGEFTRLKKNSERVCNTISGAASIEHDHSIFSDGILPGAESVFQFAMFTPGWNSMSALPV